MGAAPDVILLQESRCGDARILAGRLNDLIKIGTAQADYRVPKCREHPVIAESPGYERKADSAILYLANTMRRLDGNNGSSFVTHYDKADQRPCPDDDEGDTTLLDFDLDGAKDCGIVKDKLHFSLALEKKAARSDGSRLSIAVASVHLATSTHLAKDQGVTHDRYAAAWADQASNHMTNQYGGKVELFAIGGDFNAKRCVGPEDEEVAIPEEPPERQVCTERPWWGTLVRENGYDDDIFTDHGDPLKGNTQGDLNRQYEDGTQRRDKRIDFVFSRMAGDPVASSFDITCGMDDTAAKTCKAPLWNPARYSDHRIVWSLLTPTASGNL